MKILFKLACIFILICLVRAEDYIRSTNTGLVKGLFSFPVNAWLGIPFAENPIDELRFKHSVPKSNWSGILQTTNFAAGCASSEDCLYLNIFAPNVSTNLPVLIWIHGGGFTGGSTDQNQVELKSFSSQANVIVVGIAYRLSIFGFLYMVN